MPPAVSEDDVEGAAQKPSTDPASDSDSSVNTGQIVAGTTSAAIERFLSEPAPGVP